MRPFLLAAVLLLASGAAAQAPDGLVGRWQSAAPESPGGRDARLDAVEFRADGTADIEFSQRPLRAYRVAEPLRRDGDALRGRIDISFDARPFDPASAPTESVAYDVLLDGDRLAMRRTGQPEDDLTVADFNRAASALGGLFGTWRLASLTRPDGGEQASGLAADEERLLSYTFTVDSVATVYRRPMRYETAGGVLQLFGGADFTDPDSEAPFRLDGDTLRLFFPKPVGLLRFVRGVAAPPDVPDLAPFLGRWQMDGPTADEAAQTNIVLFDSDGMYTVVARSVHGYSVADDSLTLALEPDAEPLRYPVTLTPDGLTLRYDGADHAFVQTSGTPGRIVGRWDLAAEARSGPGESMIWSMTFGDDGTASVERAVQAGFTVADGRLVLGSPNQQPLRLRYCFAGDTLTLSRPFGDVPVLALRRAD